MRNQCDKLNNSDLVVLSNRKLQHSSRRLIKKNSRMTRKVFWNEKSVGTMKTRKTLQMNEDDEVTPTADTTTQFNWIPQRLVGSTEVSTREAM